MSSSEEENHGYGHLGSIQQKRSHSPVPSCVSMKSDQSIDRPPLLAEGGVPAGQRYQPGPVNVEMQQIHKSHLQKKFQCLTEGITKQGDARLLHEIYTALYITEGGRGEVNDEHEVRQIERASWREAARGTPINCSDIFKPLSGQEKPIRTVLTKGVAGIGKTVSVQKFILDWAEGKENQDVHFIFPLPFRELNLMKEKKLSLVELIQHFFPEVTDPRIFTVSEHRVMFIFDGLDECRPTLDFNPRCCDLTEPASVDVLLTNLIKGNLLPSALLWITTRPAAANQIRPECVDQVTEIRGFSDPQKEEYFRKRISDEKLASRTITHLKSSRSLYIMCHIPVFSWITATVVERTSDESGRVEMPRTLTQMYTHFLIIQTSMKNEKYTERKERDEEMIFKLGKLAFQQLESKNGHLDLFLRFLLGLSLESNQNLLSHLLPQTRSQSQSSEQTAQTAQCVKQKIRDQNKSDRKINLFYCLNELNHHAVVEDIDRSSGTLCVDMLLPGKWETKIFEFKIPKEQLDEFDLQKYIKTPEEDLTELLSLDEVLQKLVPVVTYSTSAVLKWCNLTEKSCSYLASALTSHSSSLTQLNLSYNELLGDSGVELLCSALSHQNCKLKELQ
ncbi:NACHT, LRR and PYD domains-containing protein 3-like [Clupea harengus]|uniref:NACHT, LRR and PYD domains-containing protein 3-like n=1 Tax=Clupea harengus TaxID=7950 RepID=A0A8M1KQA8_CLUHA|nr:NACHT, LRR and PYD domains-containing protein 3-like [Clupea harengus]